MEALMYAGIAVMSVSAASAVVAGIVLRVSGKRLRDRLEAEFGKKRHG